MSLLEKLTLVLGRSHVFHCLYDVVQTRCQAGFKCVFSHLLESLRVVIRQLLDLEHGKVIDIAEQCQEVVVVLLADSDLLIQHDVQVFFLVIRVDLVVNLSKQAVDILARGTFSLVNCQLRHFRSVAVQALFQIELDEAR